MVEEIGDGNAMPVRQEPTSHRVEQDVGEVVGIGNRITGPLEPVRTIEQGSQTL